MPRGKYVQAALAQGLRHAASHIKAQVPSFCFFAVDRDMLSVIATFELHCSTEL